MTDEEKAIAQEMRDRGMSYKNIGASIDINWNTIRYNIDSAAREQSRASCSKWRANHAKAVRQYSADYYKAHAEERKRYSAEWLANHADEKRRYDAQYRKDQDRKSVV